MLFTIFAILTVAGAVAAMSLRNLVHSVLALVLAFTGLAVVYLQLGAQFIGLAQILAYVGAVAILIVFAVLLTPNAKTTTASILGSSWIGGGTVVLAIFGILAWAIFHSLTLQRASLPQPGTSMERVGTALMLRFALPLEIIGLLLTVALIGAVTIAMREIKEKR